MKRTFYLTLTALIVPGCLAPAGEEELGTAEIAATATSAIMGKASGLCFDIPSGSAAPGVTLQQYTCHAGINQSWDITNAAADPGYYTISAHQSGLCLDIPGGSKLPGVYLQQAACTGADRQRFVITAVGGGLYTIRPKNSGLCLDAPDGSKTPGVPVQQYGCHGGTNQSWVLTLPVSPAPAGIMPMRGGSALGVAAWNTTSTHGYPIPDAAISACAGGSPAYAFAKLASGDFGPVPSVLTAASAGDPTVPMTGFPNLRATLTALNLGVDNLTFHFNEATLTSPSAWPGDPEVRNYHLGSTWIYAGSTPILGASAGNLGMTIAYGVHASCTDDHISGSTGALTFVSLQGGSSPTSPARLLADAFMNDLAGRHLQVGFSSFQPAVVQYGFQLGAVKGANFSPGAASLTIVP